MTVLLAVTILAASQKTALATQWWVSGTGNDSNNGLTQSSPFRTIGKAILKTMPGDSIIAETGTYPEEVIMKSGITLQNDFGERAIVSGFQTLAPPGVAWGVYSGSTIAPSGSVYTGTANLAVRTFYDNFTKQLIARAPTGKWAAVQSMSETGTAAGSTVTVTIPSQHLSFGSNLYSSFVDIFEAHSLNLYIEYYLQSVSDNGTTTTLTFINTDGNTQFIAPGDTLVVCNHPSLIANPGDWAYYKVPPSGTSSQVFWYSSGTANLNNAQTPSRTYGITASNYQGNFTIIGLEIVGAYNTGIYCSGGTNVNIESCLIHDNGTIEYPQPGVVLRNVTSGTVRNCLMVDNGVGCSLSGTNIYLEESEIAFNENDGCDVGSGSYMFINQCYIHNHNGLLHPDGLQFGVEANGIWNATVGSSFFCVNDIMVSSVAQMSFGNNVLIGTGGWSIDRGGYGAGFNNTINWSTHNNTFALSGDGPILLELTGTEVFQQFTILNSLFYHSIMTFGRETESNDNFYYGRNYPGSDDAFAVTDPGFVEYYTNPTGSQKTFANLTGTYGYDANSVGPGSYTGAILANAPTAQGLVSGTNLQNATLTSFTIVPDGGPAHLNTHFNNNDVIEVNGDGVPRTISGTSGSDTQMTLTFSPPLPGYSQHAMVVWDWPAGTGTNGLLLNLSPASGSPAVGYGSTINTGSYANGVFSGTTRQIPVLPSGVRYSDLWYYPYSGIP